MPTQRRFDLTAFDLTELVPAEPGEELPKQPHDIFLPRSDAVFDLTGLVPVPGPIPGLREPKLPPAPPAPPGFLQRHLPPGLGGIVPPAAPTPPVPPRQVFDAGGVTDPASVRVRDAAGKILRLGPDEETRFRDWYANQAQRVEEITGEALNPDPDAPGQFYDYRKAFLAGATFTDHWPSEFKLKGHPTEVVGGFNTITGQREPGTPRASEAELVQQGWSPDAAKRLATTPDMPVDTRPGVPPGPRPKPFNVDGVTDPKSVIAGQRPPGGGGGFTDPASVKVTDAPPDYGYGNRFGTNTPKGQGFLGPLKRPDGGVMSEFTIGVPIGGKETEIPTLVPTLSKAEVEKILAMQDGDKLPDSIKAKAVAHAEKRLRNKQDVFARPGEQQTLYPELPRARAAADIALPPDQPAAPAPAAAPAAAPAPVAKTVEVPAPKLPPRDLQLSQSGLEQLKKREGGFYGEPYQDSGGDPKHPWAIGYGMRTWKGKPVTEDLRITEAEADAEMARRANTEYGAAIKNALKVPVTQNQYDALVSMAWNAPGAAQSIVRRLNNGETLTKEDFQIYNTVDGQPHRGLRGRRGEEADTFLKTTTTTTIPPVPPTPPVPAPAPPPAAQPVQPPPPTPPPPTRPGAFDPYAAAKKATSIGADPAKQGEIGLFEWAGSLFERDPVSGLPTLSKKGEEYIPVSGSVSSIANNLDVLRAANRIKNGSGTLADERIVADFTAENAEAEQRGYNRWATMGQIVAGSVSFGAELIITSGVFKGAAKVTGEAAAAAVKKLLGEAAETVAANRAARIAGKVATGVATRAAGSLAQQIALPQSTVARAVEDVTGQAVAQRQQQQQAIQAAIEAGLPPPTPKPVVKAVEGVFSDLGDDFPAALLRAGGEQFLEIFTEHLGGPIGKVLEKIPIPARVSLAKKAVYATWRRLNPMKPATEFFAKVASDAGWDGLFEEITEEWAGNILGTLIPKREGEPQPPLIRMVTGEPTKKTPPGAGPIDRRLQATKEFADETLTNLLAFAVMPTARVVLERGAEGVERLTRGPRTPLEDVIDSAREIDQFLQKTPDLRPAEPAIPTPPGVGGPPPPEAGGEPPPPPRPRGGPPPGVERPPTVEERVKRVLRARGIDEETLARLTPAEAMALVREQLPPIDGLPPDEEQPPAPTPPEPTPPPPAPEPEAPPTPAALFVQAKEEAIARGARTFTDPTTGVPYVRAWDSPLWNRFDDAEQINARLVHLTQTLKRLDPDDLEDAKKKVRVEAEQIALRKLIEPATEEVTGATETGIEPSDDPTQHPGTPVGEPTEPTAETTEAGGGDRPGERETPPVGGGPGTEATTETEAPVTRGPRLLAVDTVTGRSREVERDAELGRKEVLIAFNPSNPAEMIERLRAGDQVDPDGLARVNRLDWKMPEAPLEEEAPKAPTDRGLLHDAEVQLNAGETGVWLGVPSTEESQRHADDLIIGLQDGDLITDVVGDTFRVMRTTSSRGQTQIYLANEDGSGFNEATKFTTQKRPDQSWQINSALRAMVERGRIERAAPTTTTEPEGEPAAAGIPDDFIPTITYNPARQSVEVKFPRAYDKENAAESALIASLREDGFEFAKTAKLWYRRTPVTEQAAVTARVQALIAQRTEEETRTTEPAEGEQAEPEAPTQEPAAPESPTKAPEDMTDEELAAQMLAAQTAATPPTKSSEDMTDEELAAKMLADELAGTTPAEQPAAAAPAAPPPAAAPRAPRAPAPPKPPRVATGGGGTTIPPAALPAPQPISPAEQEAQDERARLIAEHKAKRAKREPQAARAGRVVLPESDRAPIVFQNGRMIVSARLPSGPDAIARDDVLQMRLETFDEPQAGDAKERAAEVALEQPHLTNAERKQFRGDPDLVLERFVTRVVSNLRWLWNKFPDEYRERAKRWYEGANRIAVALAEQYDLRDEQAAGVLAVLSPNMDWFKNVSLARRVAAIFHEAEANNPEFDQALFDHIEKDTNKKLKRLRGRMERLVYSPDEPADVAKQFGKAMADEAMLVANLAAVREHALGKHWDELGLHWQAVMLRAWDESRNPREYPVITPEGNNGPLALNDDQKTPTRIGWGTYPAIANAISILRDGSPENISHRLGEEHKVRSFFNNISDPSDARFVTMDSHAVAAALFWPATVNSPIVRDTQGGRPAEAPAGIHGFNGVLAEAYFRLAEQLSRETGRTVLPREVQSVTWEAIRLLMEPKQRTEALRTAVSNLWTAYRRGTISANDVRSRAAKLVRGISSPSWADSPTRLAVDESVVHPGGVLSWTPGVPPERGYPSRGAGGSTRRRAGHDDGPVQAERAARPASARPRRTRQEVTPQPSAAGTTAPQTATAPFRRWFGNSKVVDENGQPLVVYHGTSVDFDEFSKTQDLGYHFGSTDQANYRAQNTGGRVVPVFLSLRNPIRMPDHVWDTPDTATKWAVEHGLDTDGAIRRAHETHAAAVAQASDAAREVYHHGTVEEHRVVDRAFRERKREHRTAVFRAFKAALEAQGYDGIAYKNEVEGEGNSYIAFHSTQIKSATGNVGTFDQSRPEIQHSAADDIDEQRAEMSEQGSRNYALQDAYENTPVIEVPGVAVPVPVYDTGARFTAAERQAMDRSPEMQRLVRVIHQVTDRIAMFYLGNDRNLIDRIGIIHDLANFGLHWPDQRPEGSATVYLNPLQRLAYTSTYEGRTFPKVTTPLAAADHVYETIVHEIVHSRVWGHELDFKQELARVLYQLEVEGIMQDAVGALAEAYGRESTLHTELTRLADIYSASRRRRPTTVDPLSRAFSNESRPADDAGGPPGVAGGIGQLGGGASTTTNTNLEDVIFVVKIVRSMIKSGTTSFPEVAQQFQQEYGEGARELDWALESAWVRLRGESVSVAQALQQAQNVTEEEAATDGENGPVAGGEEAPTGTERPGGDGPAVADGEDGTGTGDREGAEPRPSEGAGERGTVPTEDGERGRNSALTPPYYRITDQDAIGTGSIRDRVANNLAAIHLIKQLEREGRAPTPDEQKILVKYVGWGGLKRIFEYWKFDADDAETTDALDAADQRIQNDNNYWRKQHESLKEILTPDEFRAASNSTQNAHYTSETVVGAMWDAVRHLGVKSGSALEPSGGIGHFLGLMPSDFRRDLKWALVEKDPISAKIASLLYPGAYTQNAPFEEAKLPSNHFVLSISNVPFGLIPIFDAAFQGPAFIRQKIHNYFFAKALDRVAPGGLIAFVTSEGTLNSRENTAVREYLASRADFLGAIRLPYTAFQKNAGTHVVTDIVFLRKRRPGAAPAHVAPWIESQAVNLPNKDGKPVEQFVNEYMLAHPEMVLGTQTSTGKMRAAEQYNVVPSGDLAVQLQAAIDNLPGGAIDMDTLPPESLTSFEQTQPPIGTRPYEFLMRDGVLAQVVDGKVVPVEDDLAKADIARIKALLPVRTAIRQVYDLIAADAPDEAIKAAQKTLNQTYDKFVKKHGPISLESNWEAFREDPDLSLMLSLEEFDPVLDKATKSAIFERPTTAAFQASKTADTPGDALQVALSERGRIHLPRIAELLKTTPEQAASILETEGLIINTPNGWQLPALYLSGNVRVKWVEAEAAAQVDPQYTRAAERLKQILPVDVPAFQINARLGAPWVPADVVAAFIKQLVGNPAQMQWQIRYNELDAKWSIDGRESAHAAPRYATADKSTKDILLSALNDTRMVIRFPADPVTGKREVDPAATALVRLRKEELNRAFATWLFKEDQTRREWAVRRYNDTHNNHVAPHVDGSYLQLPGMAIQWKTGLKKIKQHQRDAIARILQLGNTLLAHVVGAGKTLPLIASGMEMRRLGLARKPLYVVPNHLLSQWPKDFLDIYPNAKILVATPMDLDAENRKRFTTRIASGDWDAVIMPYSAFARVSMSVEAETAYHNEVLEAIEAALVEAWRQQREDERAKGKKGKSTAERGSRSKPPPHIARLEKLKDSVEAKLKELADRPKDDVLTFEQLGVDALLVDESHSFKNLYFPTRQVAAGIPQDVKAQRATDMYLKTRYINQLSNYRNVVFASGTPVSNSMAEIYTTQRFLQEQELASARLQLFDAWLAQFGLIKIATELDPSGTGMKQRARLSNFRNLSDLAQMFRTFADVKMLDDLPELKKERPPMVGDEPQSVGIPASPLVLEYWDALDKRADNLDPRRRWLDNMAKISMDGRLSAQDMRLIDRRLPDDPNSKINRVVKEVLAIHKEYDKQKGTQLVFLDVGTPGAEKRSLKPRKTIDPRTGEKGTRPPTEAEKNRGIDLYKDIKDKLVAQGIPANQIAFIHDIDRVPKPLQDGARKILFAKVKLGEIRVLIGSTGKMGTGMNVQDRMVALHNVDPNMKPSDYEQRLGRILRRGNLLYKENPEFRVRIHNYVTQGRNAAYGFDAYYWQLVEKKSNIIADFYRGKLGQRDLDVDLEKTAATAAAVKAIATGNLKVMELTERAQELEELKILKEGWEETRREAEWGMDGLTRTIENREEELARYERTSKASTPHEAGTLLTATILDPKASTSREVEGHKEIGTEIINEAMARTTPDENHPGRFSSYTTPTIFGMFRGLVMRIEGNGTNAPHLTLRHPEDAPNIYGGVIETTSGQYAVIVEPLLVGAKPQTIEDIVAGKTKTSRGGLEWRDPVALVNRLNHTIDGLTNEGYAGVVQDWQERDKRQLAEYQRTLTEPFEQEAELEAAQAKVVALETELNMQATATREEEELGDGQGEDPEEGEEEEGDDLAEDVAQFVYPPDYGTTGGNAQQPPGPPAPPGPPQPPNSDTYGPFLPPGATMKPKAPGEDPLLLQPIQLPEMIRLGRDISGKFPKVVKRFRNPNKRGEMRGGSTAGSGGVTLTAWLFRKGNEIELARTLAHEFGHLIDWLPSFTLKRGNLVGRLYSLKNYLKQTFTTPDGRDISNPVIKAELVELSRLWRPWDPATAPAAFKKYRASPEELYADAISVLFNNPALLEEKAPSFFTEFFAGLDSKPAVKESYFDLLEFLAGASQEDLTKARVERDRQMLDFANSKSVDIQRQRIRERLMRRNIALDMRVQFVDKNVPFIDRVKAVEATGVRINPDADPRYFLEERSYLGGKLNTFLQRTFDKLFKATKEAGISWDTFGLALMYERVIFGDRQEIASFGGITPKDAQERYDAIKAAMSPEQVKVLNDSIAQFRTITRDVLDEAHEWGLISDKNYAELKKNPAYATFRSVDHIDKEMRFNIYQQTGMIGDTANAATSTMLKVLATLRAIERQKMVTTAWTFLETYHPDDIKQAEEVRGPHGPQVKNQHPGKGLQLIYYYENGRARAKVVDSYIGDSLTNASIGTNNAIIQALRFANKEIFRPVFTTANVGFQTANIGRDFWRYWKAMGAKKNVTMGRALKLYWQAIPMARVRAFGLPEKPTPAQLQAMEDLLDAQAAGIFSMTQNDLLMNPEASADTEIEEELRQHGVEGYGKIPKTNKAVQFLNWATSGIKKWGDFIETLPKAGAIIEFRGAGEIADIPADVRSFIRRNVGTPDLRQAGTYTPTTNEIFLFSNAQIQGTRADLEMALGPSTRSGYWWRTAALNFVPKIIQAAALYGTSVAMGLIGGGPDDDDEWSPKALLRKVQRAWGNISEYDLTNYINVPVYADSKNTYYFRLPQDDSGRMLGGLLWKGIRAFSGEADVLSSIGVIANYMVGQVPSGMPLITAAVDTTEYLAFNNVYEPFRGRMVMTPDEAKAGYGQTLPKFLGYEFQQLGGGYIMKFYMGDERPRVQTTGQVVLDLPFVSNVAGRFFKISGYGQVEQARREEQGGESVTARGRIAERDAVNDAIRELQRLPPPQRLSQERKLARDIVKDLYAKEPAAERERQYRDIEKKIRMGLIRGEADPLTDRVMSSRSNDQKTQMILKAKEKMGSTEFQNWLRNAHRQGVVSDDVQSAVRKGSRTPTAQSPFVAAP